MICVLSYVMAIIILLPFVVAFLIMIFRDDDDCDSTNQSIDL